MCEYGERSEADERTRLICQIGINYFNTSSQLSGCINDARNVEKFLIGERLRNPRVMHA